GGCAERAGGTRFPDPPAGPRGPGSAGGGWGGGWRGVDVDADGLGPEFGEQPQLPDAAVAEVGHALAPQAAEAGHAEPLQGQQVGQRRAVEEALVGALLDGHRRPGGAVGWLQPGEGVGAEPLAGLAFAVDR